jgi:hypothetical protein
VEWGWKMRKRGGDEGKRAKSGEGWRLDLVVSLIVVLAVFSILLFSMFVLLFSLFCRGGENLYNRKVYATRAVIEKGILEWSAT